MVSLPYGSELPVKDTFSGPKAPNLEFLTFPMGIYDYGHGTLPRGRYGMSIVGFPHLTSRLRLY